VHPKHRGNSGQRVQREVLARLDTLRAGGSAHGFRHLMLRHPFRPADSADTSRNATDEILRALGRHGTTVAASTQH
jgi:hypothetical protein